MGRFATMKESVAPSAVFRLLSPTWSGNKGCADFSIPRAPHASTDGRVVSNFIVQANKNEPITLSGDGYKTRSFCYVDDLIDGLMRLMESPAAFTGPVNWAIQ